jgi:hypothetical protein
MTKKILFLFCVSVAFIGLVAGDAWSSSCCVACAQAETYTYVRGGDHIERPGLPEVNWGPGTTGEADKEPDLTLFSMELEIGGMKIRTIPSDVEGVKVRWVDGPYFELSRDNGHKIYLRYLAPVTKQGKGRGIFTRAKKPEWTLQGGILEAAENFSDVKDMRIIPKSFFHPNLVQWLLGPSFSGGNQFGTAGFGAGKMRSEETQVLNIVGYVFKYLDDVNCSDVPPNISAILERLNDRADELRKCHELGQNNFQLRKEQGMDYLRLANAYHEVCMIPEFKRAIDDSFSQFRLSLTNANAAGIHDKELHLFLAYVCFIRGDHDSATANIRRGGQNWTLEQLDGWVQARLSGSEPPVFAAPAPVPVQSTTTVQVPATTTGPKDDVDEEIDAFLEGIGERTTE